jgi:hypothetical protein
LHLVGALFEMGHETFIMVYIPCQVNHTKMIITLQKKLVVRSRPPPGPNCWLNVGDLDRDVTLFCHNWSQLQLTSLGIIIIKSTRCTNLSSLFWNETLHVLDGSSVYHQEFFTVHTAMV